MASFFIAGTSTTSQGLVAGENGFVGANGTLYTETATAVTISGSASLTVLGAVATAEGLAAVRTSGIVQDIAVILGTQGSIISSLTDAIRLSVSGDFNLQNDGLISGENAVFFSGGGTGDVSIRNTGQISGTIDVNDARTANFFNYGLLEGYASFDCDLYCNVRNYGLISSDITLSVGSDVFENIGGLVGGTVYGEGGDDVFYLDRSDIKIHGGDGFDYQYSSASIRIGNSVEYLTLTGEMGLHGLGRHTNDAIWGGAGDDTIEGRSGDDRLDGGEGDDLLFGGTGNDSMSSNSGNDSLFGGAGIDKVYTSYVGGGATINLATGQIENRNSLGEVVEFATLSGIENAAGTGGNDRLIGSAGANELLGLSGQDSLFGGAGNDLIDGGVGNDSLVGGQDADTLIGASGVDTLAGGSGADVFRYAFVSDSAVSGPDRISDFSLAQDKIDLALVDADSGAAGDQAFVFVGAQSFAGAGAQLRLVQDVGANTTTLELRRANSATSDMVIILDGLHDLTADTFLL